MFYRFLGKIFFYFFIMPLISDFFRKILTPVIKDVVVKQLDFKTEMQRERPAYRRPRNEDMRVVTEKLLSYKLRMESEEGLTDAEIAEKHQLSIGKVRTLIAEARAEHTRAMATRIRALSESGFSIKDIAERCSVAELDVRLVLQDA